MTMFRLDLSDADLNTVLSALGRLPHDDVFGLIQSIHRQAQAQVATHQARRAKRASPPAQQPTP